VLAALSIFHIAALHQYGSTNPLGINTQSSTIHFGIYFLSKDLLALLFFILVFAILVFFYPEWLGQFLIFEYSNSSQKSIQLDYCMAVLIGNNYNNNNAICWNVLNLKTTQFISGENPVLVKKFLKKQSAGNNSFCSISSSETTRVIPNSLLTESFIYWLAGLVDSDGSLLVNNKGYCSFEITLDAKDVTTLYYIKKVLGFGSVSKRSNINAYRYRTARKEHILVLLNLLHDKLLTSCKHNQLKHWCMIYNVEYKLLSNDTVMNIIKTTNWFSGFFDAEGFFNIMNHNTLAAHINQKDCIILNFIKDSLKIGDIRLDTASNCFIYSITDKEGIRQLLNIFSENKLHTIKCVDVQTFKRLLYFIDNKYHHKNHPFQYKVINLIQLFRKKGRVSGFSVDGKGKDIVRI